LGTTVVGFEALATVEPQLVALSINGQAKTALKSFMGAFAMHWTILELKRVLGQMCSFWRQPDGIDELLNDATWRQLETLGG
jgi:hypothetical protein